MKANLSIKQIFARTNKLMLTLAVIPLLASIALYSRQIYVYQRTFSNIEQANLIVGKVDQQVLEEMWDVVFGIRTVDSYQRRNALKTVKSDIHQLRRSTYSSNEISALNVSVSIIHTIEDYQNQIIDNIKHEESSNDNEVIMVEVDSLIRLLIDRLKDFVGVEIDVSSIRHKEMTRSIILLTVIEVFIVLMIVYSARRNKEIIVDKIQKPIEQLTVMADELAVGHLNFRLPIPETKEIQKVTTSLNKMADDLNKLLEENALKQYHLAQSEIRVLQAQITPHFIYNSLDATLSLIEQEKYELASEMTHALSDFFRISLSKGQDWIPIEKELKHIYDYLKILKIRYGEMLTFSIDVDENLFSEPILKMVMQPLVENAVYHGTKFVRRVGDIRITSSSTDDKITLIIADNGIGMTPERLSEVKTELAHGIDADFKTGYGLYNVNKRLLLYYGRSASIKIDSIYKQGTTLYLTVPKKKEGI